MFVVTGASSGIGRATAIALASRQQSVLAVARNAEELGRLSELHPTITHLVADLAADSGIKSVIESCSSLTSIAGLVHAAGSLILPRAYAAMEPRDMSQDMQIHVLTPIALNQALAQRLDRVVFLDSYSSTDLRVGWAGYSIVKASAQMAARSASEELDGVRVIRAFPGGVLTPLVDAVLNAPEDSPTRRAFRSLHSSGELSEPDVIGSWIAELLLDRSDTEIDSTPTWHFGGSF